MFWQWNQFYDFSLAYPTMDALLKQGNFEEDSSCACLCVCVCVFFWFAYGHGLGGRGLY